VACNPAAQAPTPLPTAVPPEFEPGGDWAISFQYEFPVGTFGEGRHRFRYLVHCPPLHGDEATEWVYFEISEDAQLLPGPVYLRVRGLSAEPLVLSYPATTTVHPEQQITAVVHYMGLDRQAAELSRSCEMIIFWDDTGRHPLTAMEPFQQ
jgi:hypothetical protein